MLSNYIIRTQITELHEKRSELVKEKASYSDMLKEIPVNRNQAHKANKLGDTSEIHTTRRSLVAKTLNIDKQISAINQQITELARLEDSDKNKQLLKVFSEIFTKEQMLEIKMEAVKRMDGSAPTKLSFSVKEAVQQKEDAYKYKKIAKEQLEKMIEFRVQLTKVIEEGCKKFDQGDFLKIISPLNRLIIPVNELNKIKLKNYL